MLFSGPGVTTSLKNLVSNVIDLAPGQTFQIPTGWFGVKTGKYTILQEFDPITNMWRSVGAGATDAFLEYSWSDGQNYRLANLTGCAVGAQVVAAGSGYTSLPTVVASAGSSVWQPILGPLVSTTVTVLNGGSSYVYPPLVIFQPPPAPGVQATGFATISGGVVTGVTVVDQGAGYNGGVPFITLQNDYRDSTGNGANVVCALTGGGTLAALLVADPGNPITGTTVPTITITGGGGSGATAIAIMNWSITAYTIVSTSSGAGYAGNVLVSAYGGYTTSTAAYLNPTVQQNLVKGRTAQIVATIAAGVVTTTQNVLDGGAGYPGLPSFITQFNTAPTTPASLTFTMGGQNDTSIILTT